MIQRLQQISYSLSSNLQLLMQKRNAFRTKTNLQNGTRKETIKRGGILGRVCVRQLRRGKFFLPSKRCVYEKHSFLNEFCIRNLRGSIFFTKLLRCRRRAAYCLNDPTETPNFAYGALQIHEYRESTQF